METAKEVVAMQGNKHTEVLLDQSNWFDSRAIGAWWTNGRKDIMHMHVLTAYRLVAKNDFKIIFHGVEGRVV